MTGTILYDHGCNLCTRLVRFVKSRRRGDMFRFVSLQSEEGKDILQLAGLTQYKQDTVIYITEQGIYTRSTAVLHILKNLGTGWNLLYVFIIIPPFIRDYIYRIVARNRYRLSGRGDSCSVV